MNCRDATDFSTDPWGAVASTAAVNSAAASAINGVWAAMEMGSWTTLRAPASLARSIADDNADLWPEITVWPRAVVVGYTDEVTRLGRGACA